MHKQAPDRWTFEFRPVQDTDFLCGVLAVLVAVILYFH